MKWFRMSNRNGERSFIGFLVVFFLMILAVRGGVQMKHIAVIDAFRYGHAGMGNLILNGVFSAGHYSFSSEFLEREVLEEKTYLETLGKKSAAGMDYPLETMHREKPGREKLNLVIIMVESLTFKFMDLLPGNDFGVTPNLNRLRREGMLFVNFFASGQRSIEGVQSILAGVSPLPGIPDITALSANYPRLARLAEANHHQPLFVTSTKRESISMDLVAGSAGFDEYYGMEDYPLFCLYKCRGGPHPFPKLAVTLQPL